MIKHLIKIVWKRRKTNFLVTLEIMASFLVIFSVMTFGIFYFSNYLQPLGFDYKNVWQVSTNIGKNARAVGIKGWTEKETDTLIQMYNALREFPGVSAIGSCQGVPYTSFGGGMNLCSQVTRINSTQER